MAYTATNWQDGTTPVDASNMNKIENELATLDSGLSDLIVTDSFSVDNVSVAASSYADLSFTITKSGYTPLGMVQVQISNASTSGTAASFCSLGQFYNSSSTLNVRVRNYYSGTAVIQARAIVLYVKN